jgi:AraC-like DNA-binding protein
MATVILSLLSMTLIVKNVILFSVNNQSKLQKALILLADLSAFVTSLYFYLIATKRIFFAPELLYVGGFSFACYSIFPTIYLLQTTKTFKRRLYSISLGLIVLILIVANIFLNEIDFIKRIDLVYLSIPSNKSITLLFLQVILSVFTSLLGLKIIKDNLTRVELVNSSIQKFQFSWLSIQFKCLIAFSIILGLVFTIGDEYFLTSEYIKQITCMILIYLVILVTTFGCLEQAPITDEDIDISEELESELAGSTLSIQESEEFEEYEKIVDSIIKRVKKDSLYLDADLKLNTLSVVSEIPSYQISRSINFILSKNFNEFINDFRIAEAKRKLSSSEFENITILAVALESGFNSKSSFNAQFKKRENITPNEYRSAHSLK